ncbi:MAG: hypothetical protein ACRDUY_06790 [Nitriliruptorales bacterium]
MGAAGRGGPGRGPAPARGEPGELVHLGEHPHPYWDSFPRLDDEQVARLPQTFSLLARKPT